MRAFKLSEDEFIDLDKIVSTHPIDSPDWPGYSLRIYFESSSSNAKEREAAELIAALNASVLISTFAGSSESIDDAILEAETEANKFLASLQPWQTVQIAPQTIVGANNHGMTFVHTITITYRDLQTVKSICRHCGEELNDDSYPLDDCALAPAKTSKEQTEC